MAIIKNSSDWWSTVDSNWDNLDAYVAIVAPDGDERRRRPARSRPGFVRAES